MIKEIILPAKRTELEMQAMAGMFFDATAFDLLVEEDADVYAAENGNLLAKYRQKCIPEDIGKSAYLALREAAVHSDNRGIAGGKPEGAENSSKLSIRLDGKRSRTSVAANSKRSRIDGASNEIISGVVGYFDRYARTPYCRQTAYTMENPEKFIRSLPMLQFASEKFHELVPERWEAQQEFVARTNKDFCIPGTVFTTVTVNKNWQTALHQDAGDCRPGLGVMAVFGGGFSGGYYMFPKYKVAFNVRPLDLIFSNVHEWHCNTPIEVMKGGERISCVMYYRENMVQCGSAVEELQRAKKRKIGDALREAEAPLFDGRGG